MSRTPIRSHSELLFSSKIRVSTGALGGNGATGAIYGELTMHSMQKIINYMVENCELTSKSRFVYFIHHFSILTVKRSTTNETYNQPHSVHEDYSWPPLMNLLLLHCRFIDIGAGLGKPNLHVAQDPCCRLSLGIELETIRWQVHSVMNI
jgi:hypothetical protein